MLKKTITYTDYAGNERKEDHYFNISRAEIMEMELTTLGGVEAQLRELMAEQNAPEIFKVLKKFIMLSYGKKSPDGKRFIKKDEFTEEFMQTEAYTVLLTELFSDTANMVNFINGIMPGDLVAEADKLRKEGKLPEDLMEAVGDVK